MGGYSEKGGETVAEEKVTTCCFTGHRRISAEHMLRMNQALDLVLDTLIRLGVTVFRTGGAVGFDTVVALKVLEKRQTAPHIRLELILPCRNQTDGWEEFNREAYDYVLREADEVTYLRENYTRGCMLDRNRHLVEGSQICVGYCVTKRGGSAYTMEYAGKKGLRVVNIAPMVEHL